jgi:hypothetical protein
MNPKTKISALQRYLKLHLAEFSRDKSAIAVFKGLKAPLFVRYACAHRLIISRATENTNLKSQDNSWAKANDFNVRTVDLALTRMRETGTNTDVLYAYMSQEYERLETINLQEAGSEAFLAQFREQKAKVASILSDTRLTINGAEIHFYLAEDASQYVDLLQVAAYFDPGFPGTDVENATKFQTILSTIAPIELAKVFVRSEDAHYLAVDLELIRKICSAYILAKGSTRDKEERKLVIKCRKLNSTQLDHMIKEAIRADLDKEGRQIERSFNGQEDCILNYMPFYSYLRRQVIRLYNPKPEELNAKFVEFFNRCICKPTLWQLRELDKIQITSLKEKDLDKLPPKIKGKAVGAINRQARLVIKNLRRSDTIEQFDAGLTFVDG